MNKPQYPLVPKLRVGIVGAGIAGLTLALSLRKQRFDPILFETRGRDALVTEGAFITLAPNGMNGLAVLCLAEAVITSGTITSAIEILDERGNRLGQADQTDHATAFGAPSVTIARGSLMSLLVTACEQAGIAIHYECVVTRLDDLGDRVHAETQDGNCYDFAWLAACDGLRSQTRQRVFPEFPEPQFTGIIGTGGIARIDNIPSTNGVLRMVFGHIGFFGYLKQQDGPVYWFNSYPASTPDAGHGSTSYIARLRALHRTDTQIVDAVLRNVPEFARDYPVFDMPALSAWHRGRTVLVGDAAHAVGPHAGQGASMAIEDALVLTACVSLELDVVAAFGRFETARRPRIEKVVKLTAHNRAQKRTTNWFDRLLRRLILPLVLPASVKAARALFAYRVDADPGLWGSMSSTVIRAPLLSNP